MKKCFRCLQYKPLDDFYKHAKMGDGHLNKCKECAKTDARAVRLARIEYYRNYDRTRASLPHRVKKRIEVYENWKNLNPHKRAAQVLLWSALKRGRVIKTPCHVCGAEKSEAHHPDYSAPLDVVWLCRPHHMQAHALAKRAA